MAFQFTLRVRYHECDAQGHVFNANYLAYFDVAFTELWREAYGSYDAMVDRGVDIVVAEVRARWLGSARFDDLIAVEIGLARLGRTAMTSRLRVLRGDEQLVEGEMRHVFIATDRREPTPIPDDLRAALSPYLLDAPPAD